MEATEPIAATRLSWPVVATAEAAVRSTWRRWAASASWASDPLEAGYGGLGGDSDGTAQPNPALSKAAPVNSTAGGGGSAGVFHIVGAAPGVDPLDVSNGFVSVLGGVGGQGGKASGLGVNGVDAASRGGAAQDGSDVTAKGGPGGDSTLPLDPSLADRPHIDIKPLQGGPGGHTSGTAGNGGNGSEQAPDGGAGGMFDLAGGRGGSGTILPNDPALTRSGAGGMGGDAFLTGGNGGNGANRCTPGATGPGGHGGVGGSGMANPGLSGAGQSLSLHALLTGGNAGNGGNGGNGVGPGPRGDPGTVQTTAVPLFTNSFAPGKPGGGCPGAGYTVSLSPSSGQISIGATLALTCTVTDASGAVVNQPISWTSSDATIASVGTSGIVFGRSGGEVDITCRIASGESATAHVTVQASTNALCNVQQTPQANDVREFYDLTFSNLGVGSFCKQATLMLDMAPVLHSSNNVAPRPRVMDHTSFNIVGGFPAQFVGQTRVDAFNANYPCGAHAHGMTFCGMNTPLTQTSYIVVYAVLNGDLPATPTDFLQYGFVFDSNNDPSDNFKPDPAFPNDFFQGTDYWYTLNGSPQTGWEFHAMSAANNQIMGPATGASLAALATSAIATVARLIVSGRTLILMIPRSELSAANPSVRFTAFRHTGDLGLGGNWSGDVQRPVNQPLYPLPIPADPGAAAGRAAGSR